MPDFRDTLPCAPQAADARTYPLPTLRFLTCGSVDDGKSTLIGRLLYDRGLVPRDTLAAAERLSQQIGPDGGLDLALLVDGLKAEREQGITIDVAYRYFATDRRSFIAADCPGHEQYTRNMVTGASHCDLAVILVDARKGLLPQTRRHTCIAHLLGIRHVLLAVNKMDLVDYSRTKFEEIVSKYIAFANDLGVTHVTAIPISARHGDNVIHRSEQLSWYPGPTVIEHLETTVVDVDRAAPPTRLPVQWVCRPDLDFRGYAGTLAGDSLSVGQEVVVLPSGQSTRIARVLAAGREVQRADRGEAIMVTLDRDIDIARGDVICPVTQRPEPADQYSADIVWMSEQPLHKGRAYLLQCGPQSAVVQVSSIKYMLNIETLEHTACHELRMNSIGRCDIALSKPLAMDPYAESHVTGGFIVVDRITQETVGAGMIQFPLRRATNVRWQTLDVSKRQRAQMKGQAPCCIWFTGLSGAGKSTIANLLEKRLFVLGRHTYILDGDNVRHGLNRDLGFTDADRVENIRRVAEVAGLMVDAGLIALVSFISPFRAERQMARERFAAEEFLEIFVDAPIEICEARDAKGLYKKARSGQIANFTGISSPYEPPDNPEIWLSSGTHPPEALVEQILAELAARDII